MRLPDFDSLEESEQPSEDDTSDIADRLRRTWIDEVRRYYQRTTGQVSNYSPGPSLDGGRNAHGQVFKPLWPKLAQFVKSNKANPENFIKAQFVAGRRPVSPSVLLSNQALSRYRQSVDNKDLEAEIKLVKDIQLRELRLAVPAFLKLYNFDSNQAYKALILSDKISIGPFFRYLIAKSINEQELAAVYKQPAAKVYFECPVVYNETYAEWLNDQIIADLSS
jgi:hypothetical protein